MLVENILCHMKSVVIVIGACFQSGHAPISVFLERVCTDEHVGMYQLAFLQSVHVPMNVFSKCACTDEHVCRVYMYR